MRINSDPLSACRSAISRIECPRLDPVLKDHRDFVLAMVANLLDQNVTVLILAGVLTRSSDLIKCLVIGHADINQRRPHASDERLWIMFETFGRMRGLWIVDCRRVGGGVLSTLSAWVIWVRSPFWPGLEPGRKLIPSPRLAFMLARFYAKANCASKETQRPGADWKGSAGCCPIAARSAQRFG